MKRTLILAAGLFILAPFSTVVFCQQPPGVMEPSSAPMNLADFKGTPLPIRTMFNTEGDPFFLPDYHPATVKLLNGKKFDKIPVKLNFETDDVYFKYENSQELMLTEAIASVEFTNVGNLSVVKAFRAGFPVIDGHSAKTMYEVLSDGNITLLKSMKVNFREQIPYGSSVVLRTYEKVPEYYLYSSKKGMNKVKDLDGVLQVLSDRKGMVSKYAEDQHIKVKKESELVRLVAYFNSL